MKQQKIRGLIMPENNFPYPKTALIKRQLLFFDFISMISPEDKAIINHSIHTGTAELSETFFLENTKMEINTATRAPYPCKNDYYKKYKQFLRDANILQEKHILTILPPPKDKVNANRIWKTYVLYHAAISQESLVKSAIPDYSHGSFEYPNTVVPSKAVLTGGTSYPVGDKSKFTIDFHEPYMFPDIDDKWSYLAWLRLGRAIKTIQTAYQTGSIPVAYSSVNSNILEAIMSQENPYIITDASSLSEFVTYRMSIDVVDYDELDTALDSMSWDDVLLLRKEILPHTSSLRKLIIQKVNTLAKTKTENQEQIAQDIKNLKLDFEAKQEELMECWERLRIASVLTTGGVSLGLLLNRWGWENISLNIILSGIQSWTDVKPKLENLIMARKKVKAHPLYFTTKLP